MLSVSSTSAAEAALTTGESGADGGGADGGVAPASQAAVESHSDSAARAGPRNGKRFSSIGSS